MEGLFLMPAISFFSTVSTLLLPWQRRSTFASISHLIFKSLANKEILKVLLWWQKPDNECTTSNSFPFRAGKVPTSADGWILLSYVSQGRVWLNTKTFCRCTDTLVATVLQTEAVASQSHSWAACDYRRPLSEGHYSQTTCGGVYTVLMFGIFPNMRPRSSKTVQFILVYSNLVVKFEELNFDGDVTCKYNTAAMMWSHNQRLFFFNALICNHDPTGANP